jgi:FixJ family two-component response regulator
LLVSFDSEFRKPTMRRNEATFGIRPLVRVMLIWSRWHMNDKLISRGEIFVVDDDPAVRETLSMVLSNAGYEVICFADGAALLAVARSRTPSAVLLDVHIPGKSGLDILRELHGEDYPAPIFIISGQGDIAMAVSAIKNGALDFIEKPFRGNEIVARLDEAIGAYARRQGKSNIASLHFPGREPLTRREREVLEQFTAGASNKEAGRTLGISPRTIEDHRANIMKKLGAKNAADLVRIVMTAQQRVS